MSWAERAWWIVGIVGLIAVAPVWSEVRPNFSTIVGGAGGTPDDDSVTNDKMADDDFGDLSCASNTCTLDPDVVAANEMADADHGDISWSGGVASVDASVITSGKILDGTISANDMNRWAPILLDLCPPGASAVSNTCATLTDQGAGPSSLGAGTTMQWDTVAYKSFRLYALIGGTGATTMDLILRCDTTVNMSSTPTTMVTITQADIVANTVAKSAWTDFTANECFDNDVYFNIAAVDGNGSEDPVIRRAYVALR
jgi:hypothetical protein